MSSTRDITIGDTTVRKHRRDIVKDAVLKAYLPASTGLNIYEASAGHALFARELAADGHKVVISNFRKLDIEGVDEIEADLNAEVPLPDGLFDVVVCKEVIEHVESVPHTLRQFHRLLADGGLLILTFPNRLQIRSRLYHLLTGFYHHMRSPINLDVPFGEAHVNLIGYPEMDYFLRHAGFHVEDVTSAYYKGSDLLWYALWPLLWAATRYALMVHKPRLEEHRKDAPLYRDYNDHIARLLLSRPLFLGKGVILCARKTAGCFAPCAPQEP